MNLRRLAAVVLLVLVPLSFAADEPNVAGPKSPEAQTALAKLDAAKRKAADECFISAAK